MLVMTSAKKKSLNPTLPNGEIIMLKTVFKSSNLAILKKIGKHG